MIYFLVCVSFLFGFSSFKMTIIVSSRLQSLKCMNNYMWNTYLTKFNFFIRGKPMDFIINDLFTLVRCIIVRILVWLYDLLGTQRPPRHWWKRWQSLLCKRRHLVMQFNCIKCDFKENQNILIFLLIGMCLVALVHLKEKKYFNCGSIHS